MPQPPSRARRVRLWPYDRAARAYIPAGDGYLPLRCGQSVKILHYEAEWFYGLDASIAEGQRGWFPKSVLLGPPPPWLPPSPKEHGYQLTPKSPVGPVCQSPSLRGYYHVAPSHKLMLRRSSRRRRRTRSPPWGDIWGAAGIVALWGQPPLVQLHVCLVEKLDGRLGFPKGKADMGDANAWETALREWREESNLPTEPICPLREDGIEDSIVILDSWGCHYHVAEWARPFSELHTEALEWDVQDDLTDPDPIVRARWMMCSQALSHPLLSSERKLVLQRAMELLSPWPTMWESGACTRSMPCKADVEDSWDDPSYLLG